jgi:hypothetical protein
MPLNGEGKRQIMAQISSLICDVRALNEKERQDFVITRGQRLSGLDLDSLAVQELFINLQEFLQEFYGFDGELVLDPADMDLTVGQIADEVEKQILKEMEEEAAAEEEV